MNQRNTSSTVKNARITVVVLASVLSILLLLFAFISLFKQEGVSDKEEILAKIDTVLEDKRCYSVADYLTKFGIDGFNKTKFTTVEQYFSVYCAAEMPSVEEMARETALLFCEHLYDETDKDNGEELTDALLYCYVKATGDDYAVYRTKSEYDNFNTDMSGSFVGIGVSVIYDRTLNTVTVQEAFADSPAMAVGILPGDIIHAVNGQSLNEIDYYTMVNNIKGEEGTTVEITLIRNGETIVVTPTRAKITETSVSYSINNDTKIGYIRISSFKDNTPTQFVEAMNYISENGAVGVIFDLRDNPGGYLHSVVNILSLLVPKDTPVVSYKYAFETEDTVITSAYDGHLDIPCVVIANGQTASAGEIFTSAMKDYNDMGLLEATVVGETTYGKGIMQSTIEVRYGYPATVSDGSTLTLTTAYYNPPRSPNYHGIGVEPDTKIEEADEGSLWLDNAEEALRALLEN